MESGARSAEGGDQEEKCGGGQQTDEGDHGEDHRHLVNPAVERHVFQVDTICVIRPASRN